MRDRRDWVESLLALAVVALSMYPLYRDDIQRARLWVEQKLARSDPDAVALEQVRREISWMEHADG